MRGESAIMDAEGCRRRAVGAGLLTGRERARFDTAFKATTKVWAKQVEPLCERSGATADASLVIQVDTNFGFPYPWRARRPAFVAVALVVDAGVAVAFLCGA
jgi:hypothetical protein